MKSLVLNGLLRDGVGKRVAKDARNEGLVPCVLYGGKENLNFKAYLSDFTPLVYTPNTYIIRLKIEGREFDAVMREIQYHPVSDAIIHVDFLEVNPTVPVELFIPVRITGNAPGVRAGGKLIHKMTRLTVKGLVADFPDFVEVNISELEIGDAIKVGAIKLKNLQVMDAVINTIVSVQVTRAVVEEAPAPKPDAAAPAAGAATPAATPAA